MKYNKETMQLEGKVEIPNLRVMHIVNQAIYKANKMFNPSYNMHTEELSGEPNDRTAYDYAGAEMEPLIDNNK